MNLQDVIKAWNEQADEHNQWDMLGGDEMVEFALKYTMVQLSHKSSMQLLRKSRS